jgi:hypothetical protein
MILRSAAAADKGLLIGSVRENASIKLPSIQDSGTWGCT